jgi:ribose 5-phosphate isomerase B
LRIHIATDHAGMELSAYLVSELSALGHELIDHGPKEYDALDDYPGFCIAAAQGVANDRHEGIEALGIRAALVWNESTARLAREHNDANVVALGARQHSKQEVLELVKIFIDEPFSNDERHVRRIGKISHFEATGEVIY